MTEAAQSGAALVVGGSGGIGRATCMTLADRGWSVVVADRDGDAAAVVAAEITRAGGRARYVLADVTKRATLAAAVEASVVEFGGLDALVNVAGITRPGPSQEISDDDWTALFDIHVGGSLRTSQAAFPALRKSTSPAIVHVASVAARLGLPKRASYSSAKAAIEGLCRTLAVEWAPYGIRVNAVAPGYVRTPPVARMIDDGYVNEQSLIARIPLRRLAQPTEIASVIAFLISSDASYITGETIFIDGGMMVNGEF